MSDCISIAPVVEGQGEETAIRDLLVRIWIELLEGTDAQILKPIRQPKTQLMKHDGLTRAISLAGMKLQAAKHARMVLVIVDADDDCSSGGSLGPRLLQIAQESRPDIDLAVVVANIDFESWFVASAATLQELIECDPAKIPLPEQARAGKTWIRRHFRAVKYSETVDQARFVARLDLRLCQSRSPSFDKLVRELAMRRESNQ